MAAKEFSVFVNIGGRVGSSFTSATNSVRDRLSALTRHFKTQAAEQRAAIRGLHESFKGMAALAAGGGLVFSIKKMLGDGEDLAHEIQGLRNAGRTAEEVAQGIAAANQAIRNMPTANLTNSIKLLTETTGAFGDYHHAVENLEFNSKLGDVLKNTIHVEDPAHAIGSLIKALEIRGSAANPETYKREAGELQRAMTFFGGRLTPDMIYTFASNAQQGIRQLNERFLTKIAPSLIQEMGGDKVGTGLTAFRTIISGRKITDKKQAKAWQDLGLLNERDIIKNKMGDVTGWRDGAIKGTALAYADPMEFMETVILPKLKAKGTDIADPIKLGAALNTLFKNTKAAAFVTAISTVVDRARLKKDEALINKVLSLDDNYDQSLLNDPKLAKFAIVQAMRNMGAALTLPLMKPLAQTLISIARSVNKLSAALMEHPGAARVLSGLVAGLAALAALRLANVLFGITALTRGFVYLAAAATTSLAGSLLAVARGIVAVSAAATIGLARRLALSAGALMMLGRVGGVRAILGALALGLVGLGRAVLMFPVVALRGIAAAMWLLVANPVGLAITAIVVALGALGLWVYNNWKGIKTFFEAFGKSFMKGLGPNAGRSVESIVTALKSMWEWLSSVLGPLDEGGAKWRAWGDAAGAGVAAVVNALVELPNKIAKFFADAKAAVNAIDWSAAGKSIVDGIVSGIATGAARITGAIRDAVRAGAGWLTDKLGLGPNPTPAPPGAPRPAGERAMGGPVTKGLPYLVGERGPELFVPHAHGAIKTNGFLAGLGGGAGAVGPTVDMSAVAGAEERAQKAGVSFHAALDTLVKPAVDTKGLDEATEKASKLAAILAAIGNSGINLGALGAGFGGGGGGGGGGTWNGKALAVGGGAGIGHVASKAERAAFIKSYAASIGMDPTTALRVAQSEGFNKYVGDQGRSFGDFQLFTGGGVGNRALRAGINVRDPRQWKAADKFALDTAKREGWGQWHGARAVGIGNWQGIRGRRASGGPVDGGAPYLVGERGPEVFTPGASGGITSNKDFARLTDSAAALSKTSGAKTVHHVRGDTHYAPSFVIHGAGNVEATKRAVEAHFWDLMRRAEADQQGLLSD